jgi:hypothetical protein
VLEPTKVAALAEFAARTKVKVNPEPLLLCRAPLSLYKPL